MYSICECVKFGDPDHLMLSVAYRFRKTLDKKSIVSRKSNIHLNRLRDDADPAGCDCSMPARIEAALLPVGFALAEVTVPSMLITGANRGIGLEFVRQYSRDGWRVYASCRHPAEASELQELARAYSNLTLHRLDITRSEDMYAIAWELCDVPIDILVNNAGIYLEPDYEVPELGAIRYDDWLRTLEVNTLGPVRVTEKLLPNLRRSDLRLVVTITSHMGSIEDISSPGSYYYRRIASVCWCCIRALSRPAWDLPTGSPPSVASMACAGSSIRSSSKSPAVSSATMVRACPGDVDAVLNKPCRQTPVVVNSRP